MYMATLVYRAKTLMYEPIWKKMRNSLSRQLMYYFNIYVMLKHKLRALYCTICIPNPAVHVCSLLVYFTVTGTVKTISVWLSRY